jgi:hypothetical protein
MKLYSSKDAAEYLGLTIDGVKYHLRHGHLTGQKIGHALVFTEKELKAFQRRRRPPGRPAPPTP